MKKSKPHFGILLILLSTSVFSQKIEISDFYLEQAIRGHFDKPTGDITKSDNLESLTDVMLYNNPLQDTSNLGNTNAKVVDKMKSTGKNIALNSVEINSIYQTEPSKKFK